MNSVEYETKGLEAGGIDYLTKPLNLDLVRLRVENHLKTNRQFSVKHHNRSHSEQSSWQFIETASKLCTPNGVEITLTTHESIFLRLLFTTQGEIVTYQDIFDGFGQENDIYARARLGVLISRLREKVRDADSKSTIPIKARRNIGYILLIELPSRV